MRGISQLGYQNFNLLKNYVLKKKSRLKKAKKGVTVDCGLLAVKWHENLCLHDPCQNSKTRGHKIVPQKDIFSCGFS